MDEDELDLQLSVNAHEHMARVLDTNGRYYTINDGFKGLGIQLTPLERFQLEVSELRTDENEQAILQEYTHKIPFPMHRNAVAYYLGYKLTMAINQRRIKEGCKEINDLLNAYKSTTIYEVIRYVRWWQKILQLSNENQLFI